MKVIFKIEKNVVQIENGILNYIICITSVLLYVYVKDSISIYLLCVGQYSICTFSNTIARHDLV